MTAISLADLGNEFPGNKHFNKDQFRSLLIRSGQSNLADENTFPWLHGIRQRWIKKCSIDRQRVYFEWLFQIYSCTDIVQLVQTIGWDYIRRHPCAGVVMNYYKNSRRRMVSILWPDCDPELVTQNAPHGSSRDRAYNFRIMETIRAGRSFHKLYGLSQKDFKKTPEGSTLLAYYNGSPSNAIMDIYKGMFEWNILDFEARPKDAYATHEKRVSILKQIERKLKIHTAYQWYAHTQDSVNKIPKASTLLHNHYDGSIYKMLCDLRPDDSWDISLFQSRTNKYWEDDNNCRHEIEKYCANIDISVKQLSRETNTRLSNAGLSGLLNRFGGARGALDHLYPDLNFLPWEFNDVPDGFWDKDSNVRNYIIWLLGEVGLPTNPSGITRLTQETFQNNCGGGLLTCRGIPIYELCAAAFPEFRFTKIDFSKRRKTESALLITLRSLIANELDENDRLDAIVNPSTKRLLEYDIFDRLSGLAIEYQGEQHFHQKAQFGGKAGFMKCTTRDATKILLANHAGHKLIHIPYTWKRTKHDLLNILKLQGVMISNGNVAFDSGHWNKSLRNQVMQLVLDKLIGPVTYHKVAMSILRIPILHMSPHELFNLAKYKT